MANEIEKVEPPALPLATSTYSRPYHDQQNNILRLFFNRLTSLLRAVLSTDDGGRFLYFPRALLYSTTNQTAAATSTGYPIELENTYIGNGVSIEGADSTRVTVSADGMYNFQLTLGIQHTNSSDVTIWTWINKSGTDVPYGGQKQSIKGNADRTIHWNFSIDLVAGDYIEMYWATSNTSASLHTEAATSPHPGVPSAVLAVSFVSNL
jgi:hypothetical protein